MSLYNGITLPDRPDPVNIQRLDIMQMPMLRDMSRYGFRIDVDHFRALSSDLNSRMADLRAEITSEIPPEALDRFISALDPDNDEEYNDDDPIFNIDSAKKIGELLYDVMHLDESGVRIKKTKGGKSSTGKKTLEQLKREYPIVRMILEYRECSKLDGTYARALPLWARHHPRGHGCPICGRRHYTDEKRVHTDFQTTRAVTGRICSRRPNLANIPARTKLGALIRAGFIASEGCVLAQRDFAQIELRLMADRSRDPVMLMVYQNDGDIHIETAMRTFNITDPDKVDKLLHRAPSKNTNFAVCYGITGLGLLDLMAVTYATAGLPLPDHITEQWCDDFIEKWFGVYKGVRIYLDSMESIMRRFALTWTRMGRVRRIPGVRSALPYIQEAAIREGCNHGIQGFSADIMKLAMAELQFRLVQLRLCGVFSWPVMTIYDELIVETPEDQGEVMQAAMGEVMDNVLTDKDTGEDHCLVPIQSDGKLMKEGWKKE